MTIHREPDKFPQRKKPAHGVQVRMNEPTIVFITACTLDRDPWLAAPSTHAAMRDAWTESTAWRVGRFVIMPDHVHFFAAPGDSAPNLETWMRYWKRLLGQQLGPDAGRWQSGHWDTRMRSRNTYEEKWRYVRDNPVRHGLVEDADQWPYQGEIAELRWE